MAEIRYFAAGSNIEAIQARMYADNVDIHEGELVGTTFNPPHRLRPCLRFQWQKSLTHPNYEWQDIDGEIQDTYNISDNAAVTDSGAYRCRMDLGTTYTENGEATENGCEIRYTDPYVVAVIDCGEATIPAFTDTVLTRGVIVHHPPFVTPRPVIEADWITQTSSAVGCVESAASFPNAEVDCSGWELTATVSPGASRRGRFRAVFGNDEYECVYALSQQPDAPTAPPMDGNRRPTCGVVNNGPVIRGSEIIWRATVADPDGDPVGAEWYDQDGTFIGVHIQGSAHTNQALSGSGGTPISYTTSRGDSVMIDGSTAGTVNNIPFSMLRSNQFSMTIAGTPGSTIAFGSNYIRRSVVRGAGNTITSSTFSINGEYRYDSNTRTFSGPIEDFVIANSNLSSSPTTARTNASWTGFPLPMRLTNASGDVLIVNSLNGGVYTRQNGTGTWTFDTSSNIDYSGTPSLNAGNGIRGGGRLYSWTATRPSDDEDIERTITVAAVDYESTDTSSPDYLVIKSSIECPSTGSWQADPGESQIGRINNYVTPSMAAGDTNSRSLPQYNLSGTTQGTGVGRADLTDINLNAVNNYLIGVGPDTPSTIEGTRIPDVGDTVLVLDGSTQIDSRQIASVLNGIDANTGNHVSTPPSVGNGWSFRVAGGDQTWRNNARQAIPFRGGPTTYTLELAEKEDEAFEYRFTVLDAFVQMAFYQGYAGTAYNPSAANVDLTLNISGPQIQSTNGNAFSGNSITLRTGSASNGAVRVGTGQFNSATRYDTNALVRFRLGPGTYSVYFTSPNPVPRDVRWINGLYYEVIGGVGVNAESRSLNETLL